jgi:hypothetical protein
MRIVSRRNLSVYLVAIPYRLHRKHCSTETGTKPRQDHGSEGLYRSHRDLKRSAVEFPFLCCDVFGKGLVLLAFDGANHLMQRPP